MKKTDEKGNAVAIILLAVAALIAIIGAGAYIARQGDSSQKNQVATQSESQNEQEGSVVAKVTGSPNEEGSQAAADDEYILKSADGKTHHISTLKGENSLPADAIETCISLTGLKNNDKIEFNLPRSQVRKSTNNDAYYTTCFEGKASQSPQYFLEYADA